MKKAVFLDRDGVINREVDHVRSMKQLRLLPKVDNAIRLLNKEGYLVIIVTNQPVVARGWITEKGLKSIHAELRHRLVKKGAEINSIFYCPHHPKADLIKYRKNCLDRKPDVGLIIKAVKKFNISLEDSFLVGDTTTDIKTAKNAGITSILLKTGYGGKDKTFKIKPDYIAKNLLEATIKFILTR